MTANLDQLRGYELGAFDYVPVPVVPEILRARVKVFVDLYRKTRQFERLNAELEQQVAERTAACPVDERLERRIEERTREREKALAQLFEAQKMDTVGELTGEVAHDFNNLLMTVLGSLTLLGKRLPDDPQCRRLLHIAVEVAEGSIDEAAARLFPPPGTQADSGGYPRTRERNAGAPHASLGDRRRS